MLASLNKNYPASEEIKTDLGTLEDYLNQMEILEISFLLKSTILKTILNELKDVETYGSSFSPAVLEDFKKSLEENGQNYDLFSSWVLIAIYNDLLGIFQDKDFIYIRRNKNITADKRKKGIILKRKLKLLLPWYEFLINKNTDEINTFFKDFEKKILSEVIHAAFSYTRFGKFPELKPRKKIPYFTFVEQSTKPTIEDLRPKIKLLGPKDLPKPVEDWIPLEQYPVETELENYPEIKPDYMLPDTLPKPVDDWVFDF